VGRGGEEGNNGEVKPKKKEGIVVGEKMQSRGGRRRRRGEKIHSANPGPERAPPRARARLG